MKTTFLLFIFSLLFVHVLSAQTTLIPFSSSWKYLDNGTNQGTAWRGTGFSDGAWKTGNGKFGYGVTGTSTTISYGSNKDNKYITTYFRKAFSITDVKAFSSFKGTVYREDGIVVYVNGVEVYRNNMPAGTIAYNTLAADGAKNDGADPLSFTIASSYFTSGTNVIAAEIHQQKISSSDMLFDLTLSGTTGTSTNAPPVVSAISRYSASPTSATSVRYLVSFSEKVSGVNAGDFAVTRVSGTVAGTVSSVSPQGTGGNQFLVTVSGITGTGELRLDLKSSGTGITDVLNALLTGGYTLGQTFVIQAAQQSPGSTPGFASTTRLAPLNISKNTADKPQAKVWTYDGRWWCVLPTSSGTNIYRLDGTSWTPVLPIQSSGNARADCRVVGNTVHILLFRGESNNSYLVSAEYDNVQKTYKLWNQRTSKVTLAFGKGVETATLDIDGTGRMWVAACDTTNVTVRWSDAPYATWSSPVVIGTGVLDDDICAITTLPGKIGVLWSNQNNKRFHFRTHTDGAAPGTWSADELPGAASAQDNVGRGLADDHLNIVRSANGTLYCAVKTGFDEEGYPALSLLVRRPTGTWDPLYPVTINTSSEHDGTRGIVLLNEALGRVKVVYTSREDGGEILYRESALSSIAFGEARALLTGDFNNATSTHQTYTNEIVVLATDQSTSPDQAAGIIGYDGTAPVPSITAVPAETEQLAMAGSLATELSVTPNPVTGSGLVRFTLPAAGNYILELYNLAGTRQVVLRQGRAEGGQLQSLFLDASGLSNGVYLLRLQTAGTSKTLKLVVHK
ncbi:T9SS type A sorting domain-containing protein [Paraflavisolibacter sp. H34]|uniref:T9SS type A sorting domain-containing protein n=1 Tax=Huijunlia imazamoxiresistens TaxID=3127457 RepID=UPI003016325A